jgi:hypothetical protein
MFRLKKNTIQTFYLCVGQTNGPVKNNFLWAEKLFYN